MSVGLSVQSWRCESCSLTLFVEPRRGSCDAFVRAMPHLVSRAESQIGTPRGGAGSGDYYREVLVASDGMYLVLI